MYLLHINRVCTYIWLYKETDDKLQYNSLVNDTFLSWFVNSAWSIYRTLNYTYICMFIAVIVMFELQACQGCLG